MLREVAAALDTVKRKTAESIDPELSSAPELPGAFPHRLSQQVASVWQVNRVLLYQLNDAPLEPLCH